MPTEDDPPSVDRSEPPVEDWEPPVSLLTEGPIRERLLDVVLQMRDPEPVATVADRADCDAETARTYLEWFAEMGIVTEHAGRPVRYERNDDYLRWRRVDRIRREYTDEEIAAELDTLAADLQAYRDRFDASSPGDVSLQAAADREDSVADAWDALSEWRTLRERAELLDAARRSGPGSTGRVPPIDA